MKIENASAPIQSQDLRWWRESSADITSRVVRAASFVDQQLVPRQQQDLRHWRLYGGMNFAGLGISRYASLDSSPLVSDDRLRLNVVRSCIDTVTAKIAKHRPRAEFLTTDGGWAARQRAKRLSQFTDGLFYETKVYEKGPVIFRDSGIFGTGTLKCVTIDGRPQLERVLPFETLIHDADAIYGEPRTRFQVRWVDRYVLAEQFPKLATEILEARESVEWSGHRNLIRERGGDQVAVIEAWHLPSGDGAKDGRHAMVVPGVSKALVNEEWTRTRFPFADFRWSPPVLGWWGHGIVAEIKALQTEINYCLKKLQQIYTLHAQPMVFVREGAKLAMASVATNALGTIHRVQDPKDVQVYTPPPMGTELVNHVNGLVERCYQIVGVSALSARAEKPQGLDSGKALREFSDIESERFADREQAWETFYLDVAHLLLDEVRANGRKDLDVLVPDRGGALRLKWSDVATEEDGYVTRCFPVSSLPQTPAARMQAVQDLMTMGVVSAKQGARLLDFPDVDAFTREKFAPQMVVDTQLSRIVEDGSTDEVPEPFMDLAYAVRRAAEEVCVGLQDGMPEERIQLLRDYGEDADALAQRAAKKMQEANAPQATPAQPVPGGGPPKLSAVPPTAPAGPAPAMPVAA